MIDSHKIKILDLLSQHNKIQNEINSAIQSVLSHTNFINGLEVNSFTHNLQNYLSVKNVIPCGNGTDALQVALMAFDLKEGDEVIIPAFNYAAVIEVIALLKLKPVLVDVNEDDYNIDVSQIENFITEKTKAVIAVHLFGQGCNMEEIMNIASKFNLYVIEDNAQSIGADFYFTDGTKQKLGTIGHIGTTSFFPSKNLGAYGDGGALMSNDETLASRLKMICNHGQSIKYQHEILGVNSRLDTLQAAILNVKLKYLDDWVKKKNNIAHQYDEKLKNIDGISIPSRNKNSDHVFHQYTITVKNNKRNQLKAYLEQRGIQSMIYYPLPLHRQNAYQKFISKTHLPISEKLCTEVLSLPIHTELTESDVKIICLEIEKYFVQ